jgi:hypothetical protein
MMGLTLTALFAFVNYLISWGVFVPKQLQAFNLIAAASTMAGFPLGGLTAQKIKKVGFKVFLILADLVLCVASIIAYLILSQRGSADISDIILLAVLFSIMFFSFSFLLPIAGVTFDKKPPANGANA